MADHPEEQVLAAAVRRFPWRAALIRDQARRQQSFRDMCEELADAEAALARTAAMPPALRAERREECEGWIERLTQEIDDALRRSTVVPIRPPRPGSS